MKKCFLLLLVSCSLWAQTPEKKVWDLLLANKRTEARKLFDKELKKQANTKLEYFLLDNIIHLESGQISFDESFATTLAKFPEASNYLPALIYKPFLVNEIGTTGYDDYAFKKIDVLANIEGLKDNPIIIYNKAAADRNRRNYAGYNENILRLKSITNWQLCGPFENLNDSGIDTEYEPESHPNNDKLFDANSNGIVGWYNPKVPQNEGYVTFSNENEYGNAIMYSQVFVNNPTTRDVILNFGMSASIKLFVNDVEVYVNTLSKVTDLNAYQVKVKLPQGMNRIVVKSAISNSNCYFIVALTDTANHSLPDLQYFNTYREYNKSTLASLEVAERQPDYEKFFVDKIKANPTAVLYQLMLFDTYIHNHKNELAHDIIDALDKQYPNSSIIKNRLVIYYRSKDDDAKVDEVNKNLEIQDPNYYYTIANKAIDQEWLQSANISELESYRDKAKLLETPVFGVLYDFLINARNSNIKDLMLNADEILTKSNHNQSYVVSFAPLYDSLEKDKAKTIKVLEELVQHYDYFPALSKLVTYYNETNRKEDKLKLFIERKNNYPYYAGVASDYIISLIDDKKYPEALVEIDKALDLFPYSFYLLKLKGQVYNYMGNLKDAEKYIRESLSHNSENSELRKQLYDITKTPDEIESVDVKDKYAYIKSKRNSTLKSDYGVVTLLDEYIVNILPEGAKKSKAALIYEIVSEKGIEELKEYNLNTGSLTLQKSEIVKKDGSVVPAEEGDGTLVFSNLAVGDVVYIEYEFYNTGSGRFYKDFNLNCYFNSTYPTLYSFFAIINAPEVKYNYKFNNGEIIPTVKKIGNKICTLWKRENLPAMPLLEPSSKNYSDLTNSINVSSIKSWKDISNWYSDLVKKSLILDKITKDTFAEIFPKGYDTLSQEEIAKKIYTYIESNITYSSQDFRQSGYIPQKPSKTITTKLGDCKDVSTLFVALSQMAGLKSNLVLVSTNDNSDHKMSLPSVNFNHCIVKTNLDGKEYFLELTDKYLPFKALPISLYKANALVISFDKAINDTAEIIKIPFTNAIINSMNTTSVVTINDNEIKYTNTHEIIGANKSYYNELFSNATSEDVRKKQFEDDFNGKLKKGVKLIEAKVNQNNTYDESINFETQVSVSEKIKNVGNLKIVDIPFIDKVYTRDVVNKETRNYDVNYISYENNLSYKTEIFMNIPEGKKFTEIPENKSYIYKNHKYEIAFELVKPNSLKITRKVNTPWDDITTTEYPEFKKYVEEVLTNEEQVIGFK
jgi:hypothetical protein